MERGRMSFTMSPDDVDYAPYGDCCVGKSSVHRQYLAYLLRLRFPTVRELQWETWCVFRKQVEHQEPILVVVEPIVVIPDCLGKRRPREHGTAKIQVLSTRHIRDHSINALSERFFRGHGLDVMLEGTTQPQFRPLHFESPS